jgi:hypothetical protein
MTPVGSKKLKLIRRPVDPARKRFYLVGNDGLRGGGGAFKLLNRDAFVNTDYPEAALRLWGLGPIKIRPLVSIDSDGQHHYIGGWYGIPESLPAKPKLMIYKQRDGQPLDVYHNMQNPFVSDRAKKLLESIDPEAFQFLECDAVDGRGKPLPPFWMMAVIRVVQDFDKENSVFRDVGITTPIDHNYSITFTGMDDIRMLPDMPDRYQAFYLIYEKLYFIFSEAIVDRWREQKFKGLFFHPLQPPTPDELKHAVHFMNHEYYFEGWPYLGGKPLEAEYLNRWRDYTSKKNSGE